MPTIPLQIRKYYLDLKEAENSVVATKTAYSNAKKWAVTAIANFDFGIGPAKEIFEALQAYARMRAAYFQSIYNFKIARANLDYASGEPPRLLPNKPEENHAETSRYTGNDCYLLAQPAPMLLQPMTSEKPWMRLSVLSRTRI